MFKTAEISKEFLLGRDDPNYPPHHTGDHLEEFFLKFWESEGLGDRKLIPVHWTAVYNYRAKEGFGVNSPNTKLRNDLKRYLKDLDPKEKYFVVCSHDDAPAEELPPDTIVFGAGGNSNRIDVPIPLTCGAHNDIADFVRTIPLSFVGSLTHPLRNVMCQSLQGKQGVFISATEWSPEVETQKIDLFKQVTQRSIFSLCPRGYGATSYRLYESMQLGAIPVYMSDKHLLPWSDELDWSEFCIVIHPEQFHNILNLTLGASVSEVKKKQEILFKVWNENFSIESTSRNILKRLK